ncbi:hypothetical protein EP7_000036 [Isosphaeraceae bacterium EP7]
MSQGTTTTELAIEDEAPEPKISTTTSSILERARKATAQQAPVKATKTSPLLREVTMLLRRGHLYAGLLMLPWVFLYGVTGLLFNHPSWFSDQSFTPFGESEIRGTALAAIPSASDLAGQVVAAINAKTPGGYRLVQSENARFDRGGLTANVEAVDGKPYTVSVEAGGQGGTLRPGTAQLLNGPGGGGAPVAGQEKAQGKGRRGGAEGEGRGGRQGEGAPAGEGREGGMRKAEGKGEGRRGNARGEAGPAGEAGGRGEGERGGEGRGGPRVAAAPFAASGGVVLEKSPLDQMKQGLPALLAKLGYDKAKISEVRAAPLSFLMEGEGKRWQVTYNMLAGSVSGRPVDETTAGAELSNRRFLLRLHMTHGYPSTFNARWVWAVLVDAMSSLMIFWGVTGIIMWWQIKRTRRLGSVALVVSLIAALWVGMEMHGFMLASGGR